MIRIALATIAYGVVHSILANRQFKAAVGRVVGEETQRRYYRAFYVAQSLVTFAILLVYARRLPARVIYEVRGPVAWLLRLGQVLGVLHATYAAWTVGIDYLIGLRSWLGGRGERPLPPGPIAQGPELTEEGELAYGGPFLWSRHPLNLSPVPVFWLTPRLTDRRLVFNVVSTLYLILGSVHEEARLLAAYGERYAKYRESGVPFFWPWRRR
jgi:methanethiol S-methyltransferase